jgi:hypothetical protein
MIARKLPFTILRGGLRTRSGLTRDICLISDAIQEITDPTVLFITELYYVTLGFLL